jgi:hypothetical protein
MRRIAFVLFALLPALAAPAAEYHATATVRTGTGTEANPWGVNQLTTATGRPGVAMDALRPGDVLYLDGDSGTFHIDTENLNDSWQYAALTPAATDCTIRSRPGTVAVLSRRSGRAPIAGTLRRGGFLAHRTRFLGIAFVEGIVPGVNPSLLSVIGRPTTGGFLLVEGVEVGYCRFRMSDITPLGAPRNNDNHQCLRVDYSNGVWIHHNEFTGARSMTINSAALKGLQRINTLIEDNWVHHNNAGFFPKTNCFFEIYRRNLVEGNLTNGARKDFVGGGHLDSGPFWIYDNIFDGPVESSVLTRYAEVHHNLFRDTAQMVRRQDNRSHSWRLWSNIQLSPANRCNPWWAGYTTWPGNPPGLLECDFNVVVSKAGGPPVPTYPYKGIAAFTLAQFRSFGFERSSLFVSGGPAAIFDDTTLYRLRTPYLHAGRDGDPVGPGFSEIDPGVKVSSADILDTSRYGPEALVEREGDTLD